MNNKDESRNLLSELENLQRVLDGADAGTLDVDNMDIPVLDDLFDDNDIHTPIGKVSRVEPVPVAKKENFTSPLVSSNPFLPQATIDGLAHERKATIADVAKMSAAPAPKQASTSRFTQTPVSQGLTSAAKERAEKAANVENSMNEASAALLSLLQRERLIDELVDDIMPLLKGRLRNRIRQLIESGQ
ncbi:hypothetical protein CN03_11515 [Thalassolituus oleivorans]|uniref:hypothetical protein n=1 Tax=Thalassolituus oleivorans TaxID=187493 RepID=UPI0009493CD2|nr:hypothetical protein [Thalassolituus oleivorans]APR67504.1 hypothetical protein CN03_11515 [Thalassolituus oleivorans]